MALAARPLSAGFDEDGNNAAEFARCIGTVAGVHSLSLSAKEGGGVEWERGQDWVQEKCFPFAPDPCNCLDRSECSYCVATV